MVAGCSKPLCFPSTPTTTTGWIQPARLRGWSTAAACSQAAGITDSYLRETAYEIRVAAAGSSGGLIVPRKEKKKEKRHKLMRKLGRSKSESAESRTHRQPGLVGLLEILRAQLEELIVPKKETKKEKGRRLMNKLDRSKSGSAESQTHRQPGLVGLLEILRAQLEFMRTCCSSQYICHKRLLLS